MQGTSPPKGWSWPHSNFKRNTKIAIEAMQVLSEGRYLNAPYEGVRLPSGGFLVKGHGMVAFKFCFLFFFFFSSLPLPPPSYFHFFIFFLRYFSALLWKCGFVLSLRFKKKKKEHFRQVLTESKGQYNAPFPQ